MIYFIEYVSCFVLNKLFLPMSCLYIKYTHIHSRSYE